MSMVRRRFVDTSTTAVFCSDQRKTVTLYSSWLLIWSSSLPTLPIRDRGWQTAKPRSHKDLTGQFANSPRATPPPVNRRQEVPTSPISRSCILHWEKRRAGNGVESRPFFLPLFGKNRKNRGTINAGGCLGRLDLRAERFDTNSPRCVRPDRAEEIGVGVHVDVSGAGWRHCDARGWGGPESANWFVIGSNPPRAVSGRNSIHRPCPRERCARVDCHLVQIQSPRL